MRVFISWSGDPSRSITRALKGWLESVFQAVDAWMSDDEIRSGQRLSIPVSSCFVLSPQSAARAERYAMLLERAYEAAERLKRSFGAGALEIDEGKRNGRDGA